jgi:hypothetical protein
MAKSVSFIFTRKNYMLILASVGLLVLGFLLMTGDGNSNESGFNEDIYSFRRITLAPLVVLFGYALMVYAIMAGEEKKNRKKNA